LAANVSVKFSRGAASKEIWRKGTGFEDRSRLLSNLTEISWQHWVFTNKALDRISLEGVKSPRLFVVAQNKEYEVAGCRDWKVRFPFRREPSIMSREPLTNRVSAAEGAEGGRYNPQYTVPGRESTTFKNAKVRVVKKDCDKIRGRG
jgi:hypothetical protein